VPRRCALTALFAAFACVFAAPAAAQRGTIGADLNRPANAQITCTNNPSPAFLGVLAVPPPFNQSCTWMNNGSISNQAESFVLPSVNGTITNVRVRVGAATAPMQVAVLQAYRGAVTGCCTGVRMSQVFTPAPNSVTQVAVNLPFGTNVVGQDPAVPPSANPDLTAVFSVLGLSVLASNVPLPLHDTGVHSVDNLGGQVTYACYPAVTQPDQQCVTGTNGIGSSGFVALMQADWVATGAPPPVTLPGPAQPPAVAQAIQGAQPPRFTLARRVVPVRRGVAVFSLDCGGGLPCTGRVQLVPLAGRAAATLQRRPRRTYGSTAVNVAPGTKKAVRVRLNAAGRKLLRKRRRVRLRLQYVSGAATTNLGTVTLRR
jgi:hypothetical protein